MTQGKVHEQVRKVVNSELEKGHASQTDIPWENQVQRNMTGTQIK